MAKRFFSYIGLVLLVALSLPSVAEAQTTYHLHNEPTPPWSIRALTTANPDVAFTFVESGNYKNYANNTLNMQWTSFRSVAPSQAGTIPSGSTVSFSIWMKKTASWGQLYPYFKVWSYDNGDPLTGSMITLCSVQGGSQISDTTFTQMNLNCQTSASINQTSTRAYKLEIGTYVGVGPGNHNVAVRVYYEGLPILRTKNWRL
jgi:hypothetical protein